MMPEGFGYQKRSDDRNVILGSVAIILSIIFHVSVMVYFRDLRLSQIGLRDRVEREAGTDRSRPMLFERPVIDPGQMAEKVPGERDLPSRGPIEMSDNVSALSQETPPALVTPPPVPRAALSPDAMVREAPREVDPSPWMPRQEIKQIFDRKVQDEVARIPRHEIPVIERVPQAADVVPAIDLAGRQFGGEPEPPAPVPVADVFDTAIIKGTFAVAIPPPAETITSKATLDKIADTPLPPRTTPGPNTNPGTTGGGNTASAATQDSIPEPTRPPTSDPSRPRDPIEVAVGEINQKIEKAREAEPVPIDEMLATRLETYRDPQDPGKLYFRIAIQPRADRQMPIIPKDIVWVQDVSGSITEERLSFCRRALTTALETMNPQDRFSVIAFRDTILTAFQGWEPVTPESVKKATNFIGGMRSFGSTDILGSLKTLMTLPRDPQRPMIVFIVTDGKPTAGMTESSEIIAAFSRLNSGMMSIYMYGTHKDANAYLIDMLTYCNRGSSTVIKGNRWDIPTSMADAYMGFRNPVMSDVSILFDSASKSEIYPRRTTNLYKDRPIEVYGVCPATETELVFQVRGLAFDKTYDSVFRLPLASAQAGRSDVKTRWAMQKMFMLASVFSRDAETKDEMLRSMRQLNQSHGIPLPYPTNLK